MQELRATITCVDSNLGKFMCSMFAVMPTLTMIICIQILFQSPRPQAIQILLARRALHPLHVPHPLRSLPRDVET